MSTSRPYVIGLTGNIATGKSTVARMLEHLGAERIDADRLAHTLMRPGTEVHAQVVRTFGRYVLAEDGQIDRSRLGRIVFGDPAALAMLEACVHPAVVAEALAHIDASRAKVLCIEAIKLLEAEMAQHCDSVWVVTCSRGRQIERLVERRHLSRGQAIQRIDAQPDPALKLARADVQIENGGTLDQTWRQVLRAWNAIPSVAKVDLGRPRPQPKDGDPA